MKTSKNVQSQDKVSSDSKTSASILEDLDLYAKVSSVPDKVSAPTTKTAQPTTEAVQPTKTTAVPQEQPGEYCAYCLFKIGRECPDAKFCPNCGNPRVYYKLPA